MTLEQRYRQHCSGLERAGQGHLLRFWEQLDDVRRSRLLDDLDQVDWSALPQWVDAYVRRKPDYPLPERIEPPLSYPIRPDNEQLVALYKKARQRGAHAISVGQVAAFTVAGGQGTRLGYDGPKGAFPISPVRDAPLFQLFAEYLRGIERRYGRRLPWYLMTSPLNHDQTIRFFEQQEYFGLVSDDVIFFQQGQMPAFHPDGRVAMTAPDALALSPDGHGGSLTALAARGALADMRDRGVEYISYFQVDNPLVHCVDPLFVGLHISTGSEMSSKAVTKAHDLERVGNFCVGDGRLQVIEYSDLPESLATERTAEGDRRFDAGSIAIHVLSRTFVEKLTHAGAQVRLPWHRADKKVEVIDDAGNPVQPDAPNVVKLEMFVFDAIPLAENPILLYTDRAEEFSPVKNADGADSPATTRRDLVQRAARWLAASDVDVPGGAEAPNQAVEISPHYALDASDLRQRVEQEGAPAIAADAPTLLA